MSSSSENPGCFVVQLIGFVVLVLGPCMKNMDSVVSCGKAAKSIRYVDDVDNFRHLDNVKNADDLEEFLNQINKIDEFEFEEMRRQDELEQFARDRVSANKANEFAYGDPDIKTFSGYEPYYYKQKDLWEKFFKGKTLKDGTPIKQESLKHIKDLFQNIDIDFHTEVLEQLNDNIDQFGEYCDNAEVLSDAFGYNSPEVSFYKQSVIDKVVSLRINKALDIAGSELMPAQFKNLDDNPEVNELYGLITGRKLSKKQADALSKVTGRNIPPTSNKYDDYGVVTFQNGRYNFSNQAGKLYNENYSSLQYLIQNNNVKNLIFDGKLDKDAAYALSRAGVKFSQNLSRFAKNMVNKKTAKMIIVSGDMISDIASLYKVDQKSARKLKTLLDQAAQIPGNVKVKSKKELEAAIASMKSKNIEPVLFFNNDNGSLFNSDVTKYGISETITCNGYSLTGLQKSTVSTDFIYIQEAVSSLAKVQRQDAENLNDFWRNFSTEYASQIEKQNKAEKGVLIVGGIAGTAGVGTVVYLTNQENT